MLYSGVHGRANISLRSIYCTPYSRHAISTGRSANTVFMPAAGDVLVLSSVFLNSSQNRELVCRQTISSRALYQSTSYISFHLSQLCVMSRKWHDLVVIQLHFRSLMIELHTQKISDGVSVWNALRLVKNKYFPSEESDGPNSSSGVLIRGPMFLAFVQESSGFLKLIYRSCPPYPPGLSEWKIKNFLSGELKDHYHCKGC